MPSNRYYVDTPLEAGQRIHLEGDEWHHLSTVSRGRIGESVELINGKGILTLAQIKEIHKREGTLLVKEILKEQPAPPTVILCLALSRMNHLEWAVEKATELGAASIWLFPGALSEKDSLSTNQLIRLHSLVLAATKQCGRLYLPEIKWIPSLNLETAVRDGKVMQGFEPESVPLEGDHSQKVKDPSNGTDSGSKDCVNLPSPTAVSRLKEIGTQKSVFLCDTAPEAPYLWDLLEKKPLTLPALFLIGPESGFSEKEVHFFKTTLQAQGIKLHPHILRTETAPLVALSLIQRYL